MKGRPGTHAPQLWVSIILSLQTAQSAFHWIFLMGPGLIEDEDPKGL